MKRNVVVTLIVLTALCLAACHKEEMANFRPPRQKAGNKRAADAYLVPPPSSLPPAAKMQGVESGGTAEVCVVLRRDGRRSLRVLTMRFRSSSVTSLERRRSS